jgi:hypothetical protein
MRKFVIPIGLLLVLLVAALPAGAITWGQLDTAHPFVGAMVVDWPDYGPWQLCSGTLIHPQVVLTAGHCTYDLDDIGITTVWVNFDPYALNPDTLLEVSEWVTHPEFDWAEADKHDVGALILAEPVTGITPAALPVEGFLQQLKRDGLLRQKMDGAPFTVVGYGGSLDWPPPDIWYDDMRQYAESEYVAITPVWLHMDQHILKDNAGTCFGDSGGPAFWTEPDGTEILVGITSTGDAQCIVTGLDYRVDIAQTLDFIDGVIGSLP